MTGLDALQSVQFITTKNKRFAIIDIEDWESMIEWLETLEDVQIAKTMRQHLKDAGGDRKSAQWLPWDEVKKDLD